MKRPNTVTVVGLGKIGLPLAVQLAMSGFRVLGTDINPEVVRKVNDGIEPFPGEKQLGVFLKEVVSSGTLSAGVDTEVAVSQSGFVIVVVPLYVDEEGIPDFLSIDKATEAVGRGLREDTLVSYETTLPIGTTRNRFKVALEKYSQLEVGKSFYLVFSPERVMTGSFFENLKQYPKLVGGIDIVSEEKGIDFYKKAINFCERPDLDLPNGVWSMGSSEAAEFAKLAETTYRDVNIALANQFALYAQENDINVYQVIQAANSQPLSRIHKPGIAVGGHCIPIYPQMYLWNDPSATIVKLARRINSEIPRRAVMKLQEIHGSLHNETVAVLGISYRGGVKEATFSGVFPIVKTLQEFGARVLVHDPMYCDREIAELGLVPYKLGQDLDAAVIQADHAQYFELKPSDLPGVKTIMDGRGVLLGKSWKDVKIHTLGRDDKK